MSLPQPRSSDRPANMPDGGGTPPGLVLNHWALIGAGVIANGVVGEKVVRPRTGEYGAHLYKTAVAVPWILAVSRLHARRTGGEGSVRVGGRPDLARPLGRVRVPRRPLRLSQPVGAADL